MKYRCAHYLIVAWLVVGSTASNVASNEEGEWSSVGPSDCCDPPPNLPPDALHGQKGYHVDSVVIDAPDVDVQAFLAGIEDNNVVSPIATTTTPHGIVSTSIIDSLDTTMGGGGFHPVEMNVTEQRGFLPSASASSSILLFPDTGLDESEIKSTPIDEQLVAYEDGTLLEEIQAETGMVKTAESEMAAELYGDNDSRRLMGHLDRSEHHKIDRRLQVSQGMNTAPIGLFKPLACNANIDTVDCSTNKMSTLVSGTTTKVMIPCGMCYTYDLPVTPTTIGGLDIIGKLYVPPNHKSTLMTKFVFVQGVLVMSDTSPISKNNTSMKIVLTGDSDVTFTPAAGNANVAGGTFNAGIKPFLVAGGRLDIRGWTGSLVEGGAVETWTPLLEMAEGQRPNPTLSSIAGKESTPLEPPVMVGAVPSQQCPRKLVDHNFDDTVDYRVWSGGEGMILHHTHDQGKAIVLDGLGRVEQGFRLDYSDIIKGCPIIANATYLVTMRVKVEVNGTAPGTKSVCQLTGNSCPRIYRKILRSTGGDRYTEQHMQYANMGLFSEWFWFSTLWTWTGDDLTNVLGGLFIIDRFPIGAKVSLDEFIFELPSTKSFAPTSTVCSELAINGNAEDNDGNGYSHYPFISNQHSNPLVYEETVAGKVNRFYRIRGRDSASWNTYVPLQFRPNTACFMKGHVYTVSLRTRLFYYNPTEKMKFYIRLVGRRPTSDTSYLTVLRCPEMTQSNEWTTCSAPLLVTEELASLTDVRWETITEMENATNRALIDFDDISIKWKSGVSEGLVVSTSAVSRWASNSDIHITSSTLNWRDSQDAVINSIEARADDKSVLKLNTGIVPVLSEKETPGLGVEIAMLTRNIKIEGETLVDQCGTDRIKQTDYRGNIATTVSGISCQKWTAQSPHTHSKTPQNYPNAGLGDHSFCRNPDGQEKAWCYTTNPSKQWEFCNVPTCKGGYLQVLHTNVTQVIEGLELTNMGQQGVRNRFPIQFLYTRDVKGTSISRNSIRNSNHRCIVMDGASNATIAANVAHDTAGHCYFFGYEANHNKIISNLGSKTNDVIGYGEQLAGQSDHDRATFLVRSSENDFIGNVAGGGAGRGFMAQLHWKFVGEDDCEGCDGIDPSKRSMRAKPMGIFRNNKAHSNSWQGFILENFEQFYTANVNVPVFENTMAYRNREHGIYTYNNVAAEYRGGKMTDNQWGISLISSDRITLQDFDIVGSSQVFKDHTATRDTAYQLCPSTTWRHEGIRMMSQIWRSTQPADPNLGLRLRNVSISGFDKEKEWYPCMSTEPITIIPDGWANSNKHFDYISSVVSVKISDSRGVILNGCEIAATAGVKDLIITDMNGSFDPSKNGTSGSLVHDYDHVTGILGVGACTSIGKCLAFCPNACLRTFTLKVEQFGTENWKLRIKRALPETTMDVPSTIYTHSEAYFSDPSAGRKFSASLPAGKYTAEFINENGDQVWPQYVEETWQKPPDCAGFAQVDSVTVLKPPISEEQCVELVRNGGIHGNTTFPWISTLGQPRNIVIRKGMGIDGTDAIGTMNREYHRTGLGQDIDSRCLELMRGKLYEFSAYMKITAKNNPTTTIQTIDPNKEFNSNLSPVMSLNMRTYQNISTKEFMTSWEDFDKAVLARPYNHSSFNLVHGIFRLPPNSVRAFFEIERSPDNQDYIVDNVSLKRMVCDPNKLILNGDFTEPNTKYWDTWGGTVSLGLVTGYGGTGQALKASTRPHLSHGPAQIINTDCVPNVGDRLAFTGKIRFEKSSLPGVASPCNPFTWSDSNIRCSDLWMFTNKNGVHEYNRVAMISTNDFDADNGWYSIHGLWSLRPNQALADYTKVYLDGISTQYDVIIDNMEIKHLPLQCDTLVENPSFINGSAYYWHATDRDRLKLKIYSPGAGGQGDFALRAYDRDHSWRGMRQQLDKRCFVTGEEYSISAKFRLLNSTSGIGLTCIPNDRTMTGKNCPSVMIYGEECAVGGSRYINWRLWNTRTGWQKDSYNDFSTGFQVNDALASCLNVWVYVNEVSTGQDIVVDDLHISKVQITTPPPTLSPTTKATDPENKVSDTPTHSPTSMPTVSTVTSCPNDLFIPVEIPSGPVMLARSSLLCILTKAIRDPNGTLSGIAPVALSYDGGVWEKAAGEFAFKLLNGQEIGDYSTGSQLTLPNQNDTSKYYLTSYSHTISEADKVARLLETATFGTTAQDIDSVGTLTAASANQWIINQMNMNLTSHREYFRKRTNPRLTNPVGIARSGHPCDPVSRWRRFAFSKKEGENGVITVPRFIAKYDNLTTTFVTIMMNDFVRTVVKPMAFAGSKLEFNKEYLMCSRPEEYAGGWIALRMGDNTCQNMLPNPIVAFYNTSAHPNIVLSLPNLNSGSFEPIDDVISRGGEFILRGGLVDPVCSQINDVVEENDEPIFGRLPDGSWLLYDSRMVLEDNAPTSPINDGGGLVRSLTALKTKCANAPRTFLNEEHCFLSNSSMTCGAALTPSVNIELSAANIITLNDITGQYIYGIAGLPLRDVNDMTQPSPCVPNLRSRWEILEASKCTATRMGAETNATLVKLLSQSGTIDMNQGLRDVTFPLTGMSCSSDHTTLVEVDIIINTKCFRRVHPEHLSVYDFTYWAEEDTHPGNMVAAMRNAPHPIKKWMDLNRSAILLYPAQRIPGNTFLSAHPINRWNMYSPKFTKVGRFGDMIKFVDLPNEIRQAAVAEYFGANTEVTGRAILTCGSPFETANDPNNGHLFEVTTERDTEWNLWRQREYIWTQISLTAPDQLRQRVAWAFAQLLVIARFAIEVEGSHTEAFLTYYDIFVRHAFGNYRDVLREISHSPLMAENLSYLQSKSAAYMWENQNIISFADENFAREIMQLFTTGLNKLNIDGTPMLDNEGQPIQAYTNEEIMSFARIWTGFDYQQGRGNVEENTWSGNRHDPMKIQAGWRDKFPKTDMTGGYIGDGYPLCTDLPAKMYLKKGAQYRLLGSSHMPELMEDDPKFITDLSMKKFALASNSTLKSKLCNADSYGNCQWKNTVILEQNLDCTGQECAVDTVRVVQVSGAIHYEYVRPACVEQAFYSNAKKVIYRHRNSASSCANPTLPYASEACCTGTFDMTAERAAYLYDQERVTYSTADARCKAMNMGLCDFNDVTPLDWSQEHKKGFYWTSKSCAIQVKVDATGQVALVYEPEFYAFLHPHVRSDNRNFFKVYWEGDYPKNSNEVSSGNSCGNNACASLESGGCLCGTTMSESRVFARMPKSVNEVLSALTVGAYDPAAYPPGKYAAPVTVNGVKAYVTANGSFDTNTVFEVFDEYGRLHRFKNVRSTVSIVGASTYVFRNAPSFMSVLNTEATARDAQYETEAALDHYFYHDNTAPFIAFRLIQRLTTSNPKPRYVKSVATAFRTGNYEGIGKGKYGDLAATVAAILLDREARSVNLDADPFKGSLREPLIRMTALMRGMEIQLAEGQPIVKLFDLDYKIGMMAHGFRSVFSFFLPEYVPSGKPRAATLVAPETMLMDMPKTVGLLNGMFSLVKYGLSRCYGGFGDPWTSCNEGSTSSAAARLSFSRPYNRNTTTLQAQAENVVRELATILTSGRLSAANKAVIKDEYIKKLNQTGISDPAGAALRMAQQLVLASPEFHTTNIATRTGAARPLPPARPASGAPYKAIVYVLFSGGCDSYNMLVPHTCSVVNDNMTLWDEYVDVRQNVALSRDSLNLLNGTGSSQACETFGVHPRLGSLAKLYNEGDLLFHANTGELSKETNKENYWRDTITELFAHNFQQQAAQKLDPLKAHDGTGVLGRIRDILMKKKGRNVGAFSINANSISIIGKPGIAETPTILSENGVTAFNSLPSSTDMDSKIALLNGETNAESGVFADWFSTTLLESLANNKVMFDTLSNKATNITFPTSGLGRQLSMVAKMIDSRAVRRTDADMFFVETGGWDTHDQLLMNQERLFADVDASLMAFANEMKAKNTWNSVTLIETSDFARTNSPNGNAGSDHAWGGNYIMMGGGVKGGQLVGTYPSLREGALLNIGRGRMIPTKSWESVFLPIAKWAGVDEVDFDYICPNRKSFPASHFTPASSLFDLS